MKALALVPARLASSRLARKMLLRETGRYLFEHTVRNVQAAGAFERVVLATDSEEILCAARAVGIEVLLTSGGHRSGTDRVREAHARLRATVPSGWDVIANVQGDEPEIPPGALASLIDLFQEREVEMATLASPIFRAQELADPGVVKVVLDRSGDALYFSRAPIPAQHPARGRAELCALALRHVGVYAFRPAALERFCALGPSPLEEAEGLEQLRWLEAGGRLRVRRVAAFPAGIDDAEHYASFVARAGRSPSLENLSTS
jgi:3-deoxy-manno-octulosonate cytidylyltransferase (CMP-KDO synthetase)